MSVENELGVSLSSPEAAHIASMTFPFNQNPYVQSRNLLSEPNRRGHQYEYLFSYEGALDPGFLPSLFALRPGQVVVDGGGGSFQAWFDYFYRAKPRGQHAAVIGIADMISPESTLEILLKRPDFIALLGKKVEDVVGIPPASVDLIIDVYGAFSYSSRPDLVLKQYLTWLKIGGKIFIANRPYIEGDPAGISIRTPAGLKGIESWFQHVKGIRWTTSGSDNQKLVIERTPGPWSVPKLVPVSISANSPPIRIFELPNENFSSEVLSTRPKDEGR